VDDCGRGESGQDGATIPPPRRSARGAQNVLRAAKCAALRSLLRRAGGITEWLMPRMARASGRQGMWFVGGACNCKSGSEPPHSKTASMQKWCGHGAQQCCAPTGRKSKPKSTVPSKLPSKIGASGVNPSGLRASRTPKQPGCRNGAGMGRSNAAPLQGERANPRAQSAVWLCPRANQRAARLRRRALHEREKPEKKPQV